MKWLSFIGVFAIFACSCERHPIATLDALPGHHEAHGDAHGDTHDPAHAPEHVPHEE